jgi:hypothetical protein
MALSPCLSGNLIENDLDCHILYMIYTVERQGRGGVGSELSWSIESGPFYLRIDKENRV